MARAAQVTQSLAIAVKTAALRARRRPGAATTGVDIEYPPTNGAPLSMGRRRRWTGQPAKRNRLSCPQDGRGIDMLQVGAGSLGER